MAGTRRRALAGRSPGADLCRIAMTLVFHQAALGDFVLIFPLLRGMAATGERAVVVARRSFGRLASRVIAGVEALDIDRREFTLLHGEAEPEPEAARGARELIERAGRVVSFVSDGRDVWAANVRRWMRPGAGLACVPPRPPEDWTGHVHAWHVRALAEAGCPVTPVGPALRQSVDGPVVMHLGSGGAAKRWPIERWEALAVSLRGSGREALPVLGEVELETWPPEAVDRWVRTLGAELQTDLWRLQAALGRASCFIGADSGPTHLAAQMGVPTVALFGPTDPRRWRPLGPRVTVLAPPRPAPMAWLEVDRVRSACEAIRV